MLSASTRGLPKRAPLVAPFSTLPTRTSPPSSTRPSQVPTVKTSSQLVPFTQRSQYASGPIHPKIDKKSEEEIAKKKLESRPGEVTSDSSTIHFLESSPTSPEVTKEREEEVSKGVVRDLVRCTPLVASYLRGRTDSIAAAHRQGNFCPPRRTSSVPPTRSSGYHSLPGHIYCDDLPQLGPQHRVAIIICFSQTLPDGS